MWSHFIFVVTAQFLFFLLVTWKERARVPQGSALVRAVLAGALVGAACDVVLGRLLGIFGYVIDTTIMFLFLNGIFSYGIMLLTVLAWRKKRLLPFYGWSAVLGIWYEIANGILPLWHWSFLDSGALQEAVLIGAAYFGLSIMLAVAATFALPASFRVLSLE